MRNLKRALSLTLASVMLLGMMVVGAGAAGYPDVKEEHNVEAIEVLQAVKVMQGNDQGNFDPDSNVNRAQMAVVMANLLKLDYNYYEGSCPFWDVPDWAKPYVAACYANGIVSGYNATTYGAGDSVTAVQAASMMMRALGYFKYQEDYDQNGGFEMATVLQANKIGLFDGLGANATAALTRNQVAKLALNALEANMVTFTGTPGTSIDLGDGKKVNVGYKSEYTERTGTEKKYAAMSNLGDTTNVIGSGAQGRYYVQLGEELYNGKLTKASTYDVFERPTTTWRYDYTKIGEYLKAPDMTYTKDVKLGDIYSDLGLAAAVVADKVDFFRNGDTETTDLGGTTYISDNSATPIALSTLGLARGTGNKIGDKGVLTQVWYYGDTDTARITMIDTYVGKISSVVAATSSADRYVVVNRVLGGSEQRALGGNFSTNFETENFEVDDLVMFTAARDDDTNRYVIETVDALEVAATGLLTRWEGGTTINTPTGTSNANFTAGGTKYDYSRWFRIADENDAPINISNFTVNKSDVNVYLDKYGYAIYVSGVKGAKNYAAVIGWGNVNQYGSETRGATLLLPDGTQQEVIAKKPTGTPTWSTYFTTGVGVGGANLVSDGVADLVTYTVGDDGIYTLTLVGAHKTALGTVYSGKYDTAAGAVYPTLSAATFESGKSLMTFGTQFPGTAPVAPSTDWTFGAANPKNFYTTSETIFMVATNDGTGKAYNVYTGYANAPSFIKAGDPNAGITGIAFAMDSRYTNQIDVVYIDAVDMAGVSSADTYFVKAAPGKNNVITDNDNVAYFELPAVVNNEITTIRIQADMVKYWDNSGSSMTLRNAPAGVYALNNVRTNNSGYITGCSVVSCNYDSAGTPNPNNNVFGTKADGTVNGRVGTGTVQANEIVVGIKYPAGTNEFWAYNTESKVYYIANDYKSISEGTVASVYTDNDDNYWMTVNSSSKVMTKMFIHTVDPGVTYAVQASNGVLFSSTGLNGTYYASLPSVAEGTTVYVIANDVTAKPIYGNALTLGGYTSAAALNGTVSPATAIPGHGAYSFTMPAAAVIANSFTTANVGFGLTDVVLTAAGSGNNIQVAMTKNTALADAATAGATVTYDVTLLRSSDGNSNWMRDGAGLTAQSGDTFNITAGTAGAGNFMVRVTIKLNGTAVATVESDGFSMTVA